MSAVEALAEADEPALLAFPDLYRDITDRDELREILAKAMTDAESLHDRLVLVDALPKISQGVSELVDYAQSMRESVGRPSRAAALYYPYIKVPDPLGGVQQRCGRCRRAATSPG